MIFGINWPGLTVDIIRRLWDRGLYVDNKILIQVHDNWFEEWVDYRTDKVMGDVDAQVEQINPEPVSMAQPTFWEEGDTIGFSYDFVDSESGPTDSV